MCILPNISRNKSNHTKKFGQLLEHIKRNISVEKSYTECGGETIPRPFSKKLKRINSLKFYTVCFYYMVSWGSSKYTETELPTI